MSKITTGELARAMQHIVEVEGDPNDASLCLSDKDAADTICQAFLDEGELSATYGPYHGHGTVYWTVSIPKLKT